MALKRVDFGIQETLKIDLISTITCFLGSKQLIFHYQTNKTKVTVSWGNFGQVG